MTRSEHFLLACCLTLAFIIYWQLTSAKHFNIPRRTLEKPIPSGPADPVLADMSYSFPPLRQFSEITMRPLFTPDRRASQNVSSDFLNSYTLRGIALLSNRKLGLLERRSDGAAFRVSEGDVIDGWEIALIDTRAIELRSSSGRLALVELTQQHATEPAAHDSDMDDSNRISHAHGRTTGDISPARAHEHRFVNAADAVIRPTPDDRYENPGAADHNSRFVEEPLLPLPPPPLAAPRRKPTHPR